MLAAAISLAVFVVVAVVLESNRWGVVVAAGVETLLVGLWYAVPLTMRRRARARARR